MNISSGQNSFYHKFLSWVCNVPVITIQDLNPCPGIRDFTFNPSRIKSHCGKLDGLKQLLKAINLDYPRNIKGDPISTTKITSIELYYHIRAIEKFVYDSGGVLPNVEQEIANDEILAWSNINETKIEG